MAAKKVGELIKEARTKAGLSQEALAKLIDGVSASDIGKAERGEKELTQAALKAIAKATGVTQKSLLEAPKGGASAAKKTTAKTEAAKKTTTKKTGAAKTEAAKKTGAAKTEAAKKTDAAKTEAAKKTDAAKTEAAKKTGAAKTETTKKTAAKKTTTAAKKTTTAVELTAAEKTLINAYRKADAETQKAALSLLKGEKSEDLFSSLLSGLSGKMDLMDLLGSLGGKK